VKIWNVNQSSPLRTYSAHKSPVLALAFADTEPLRAVSCDAASACLWDLERGVTLLQIDHESGYVCVQSLPNGTSLHSLALSLSRLSALSEWGTYY
jgi:WD40 repeat protein